jgi:hypothetical protein
MCEFFLNHLYGDGNKYEGKFFCGFGNEEGYDMVVVVDDESVL